MAMPEGVGPTCSETWLANARSQIRTPTAVLEIKALYWWRSFTIN
jgi:hypothetical protein